MVGEVVKLGWGGGGQGEGVAGYMGGKGRNGGDGDRDRVEETSMKRIGKIGQQQA